MFGHVLYLNIIFLASTVAPEDRHKRASGFPILILCIVTKQRKLWPSPSWFPLLILFVFHRIIAKGMESRNNSICAF